MNRKIYLMPWVRELDLVAQGLLAVSPGADNHQVDLPSSTPTPDPDPDPDPTPSAQAESNTTHYWLTGQN